MKDIIDTLRKKQIGYGHFHISISIDGKELNCNTTNTIAIDAAFDEYYDDNDNNGRYYESKEKAQIALIDEILIKNKLNEE